jgi:large subunit ribosomal protein L20
MARVKRGTTASKRRKNTLKHTKGFCWGRKSKFKQAKEALMHAWTYAFRDRKTRKRNFRRLWQSRINSACQEESFRYSEFIGALKKNNIELDRKVLSQLSEKNPEVFKKIVESLK